MGSVTSVSRFIQSWMRTVVCVPQSVRSMMRSVTSVSRSFTTNTILGLRKKKKGGARSVWLSKTSMTFGSDGMESLLQC